jgi:KaiC/GvpD/RAD55 family RecA-like ATPase
MLVMKGKTLRPLKMDEISFSLKSFKKGTVEVKPRIVCLDLVGHDVSSDPDPVIFNVTGAVLSGRVRTGFADLDNLLFGGIPENYAVVLTSPATDEREQLIRKFLESGTKNGQVTFYICSWIGNVVDLIEKYQSKFSVFVCNPRSDILIKNMSNVFKIGGVERITDLDIALIKAYRQLDKTVKAPRRICISIVSDVLLEQHAVRTRKWLNGLLPNLKAKGFTTLAVVNPDMHPREEVQAILSLFDGEIRVREKESAKGLEQRLRIRKLYNQQYLENEITLTRERIER